MNVMNMPFDQHCSVSDAVTRWPALIPFFEKHRIDFCCHGGTPLRTACEQAGVSLEAVADVMSLASADTQEHRDWTTASMSELCDHIVERYHLPTRERFEVLRSLIPKVVAAHSAQAPWLVEIDAVEQDLRSEMLDHMIREERVLFPWIKRLEVHGAVTIGPPWSVKRPIDCMMHDHDSVGAALYRIRNLTNNYIPPTWACPSAIHMLTQLRSLESDTHVHIHLENNLLFPAAIRAETNAASARTADNAKYSGVDCDAASRELR